ncbi:lipid-transfer protein [Nocardiopsis suaedae]|uniref:lipid-transfer protein n=1 Tax=Nocardiopsis suaedae TaxID=3018444 RepID=UPI0038CD2EB3
MTATKAVIAGIGATGFSKDSGRSETRLAADAALDALADAGISPEEVDGMATFTMDPTSEIALAREIGAGALRFFTRVPYGGGAACGAVAQAAMAAASGTADVVLVYRAFNERSGRRYGRAVPQDGAPTGAPASQALELGWHVPAGLATPAAWAALPARRYMHEYGATGEDFGRVAVQMRANAATNPRAWFHRRPITLEEHQASRWVAEPLRLLDCCQESDGGVALVVVGARRARSLPRPPAVIEAAAQGSGAGQLTMVDFYRDDIAALPEMAAVAERLWADSGLGPGDMDAAILYDHFTPYVLMQLEALGYCKRGQAPALVADGRIGPGGDLPVNPHGGQLGEAYIHGMNGIAEAVRQLRGTAANQVPGAGHVLVTAGTGVPTSGLVLGAYS